MFSLRRLKKIIFSFSLQNIVLLQLNFGIKRFQKIGSTGKAIMKLYSGMGVCLVFLIEVRLDSIGLRCWVEITDRIYQLLNQSR